MSRPLHRGVKKKISGLRPGLTNRVPVQDSVSRTPLNFMWKADFSANSWSFSKSPPIPSQKKVAHLSIPLSIFRSNYVAFIFLANFCLTVGRLEPDQWMTFPKSCNSRPICTDYMTRARLCLSLHLTDAKFPFFTSRHE